MILAAFFALTNALTATEGLSFVDIARTILKMNLS